MKQLKVAELSDFREIKRKFVSSVESAFSEIIVVPTSIPACMIYLVASVASALVLFGVSDTTAKNTILKLVFANALVLSVMFLMLGIYLTYKFIGEFIYQASMIEIDKAFEKSLETFSKKLGVTPAKKKE